MVQDLFQVKDHGHVCLEHENLVPTSSLMLHVLLVRCLKDELKLIKREKLPCSSGLLMASRDPVAERYNRLVDWGSQDSCRSD
jgi:hypothetical protein